MRTKAKRDANEPKIVAALRANGIGVYRVNQSGYPDLTCWRGSMIRLLELKSRDGRLTKAQRDYPGPRIIVHTIREALACFGIIERL